MPELNLISYARTGYSEEYMTVNGWKWLSPKGINLRDEGWKLHISGTKDNAATILSVLEPELLQAKVVFKFLPNSKDLDYQTEEQEGKWLVVYPESILQAFGLVYVLDQILKKWNFNTHSCPVIKGERLAGETIIYTRYGGFINDNIVSATGGKARSKRGTLKPSWIRDPWAHYDPNGDVDANKLLGFPRWPKHPRRF